MSDSRTEPHIRRWLELLANVTAGGNDPVSAERIAVMAGFLAMDGYPVEAFCQRSAHHCAQNQRFFPAYDDVRKALQAWWEANRQPVQAQIAGPGTPGLDAMDRRWVAYWHKRRAEIWAADDVTQTQAEVALETVASLVRAQSSRAWEAITGTKPVGQRAPTPEQAAYVARLLRPPAVEASVVVRVDSPLPPLRDVTAKESELDRLRGKVVDLEPVGTDREEWG